MKVAKNAQTNPVGELRGILIASYFVWSFDSSCPAARLFIPQ